MPSDIGKIGCFVSVSRSTLAGKPCPSDGCLLKRNGKPAAFRFEGGVASDLLRRDQGCEWLMRHKRLVHDGQHGAIIAPDLWDAVQAGRRRRCAPRTSRAASRPRPRCTGDRRRACRGWTRAPRNGARRSGMRTRRSASPNGIARYTAGRTPSIGGVPLCICQPIRHRAQARSWRARCLI